MSSDLPGWMVRLIAGLDRYDREHPELLAQVAGSSGRQKADCPCHLLSAVPNDVIAYARGWQDGVDSATPPIAAVEPTTEGA